MLAVSYLIEKSDLYVVALILNNMFSSLTLFRSHN